MFKHANYAENMLTILKPANYLKLINYLLWLTSTSLPNLPSHSVEKMKDDKCNVQTYNKVV